MKVSRASAVLLAAALLPAAARAQLGTEPLVVPVPDATTAELAGGSLGVRVGADVLLFAPGGAGSVLVPSRAVLSPESSPLRALDGQGVDVAAGRLFRATPAGKADLVFVRPTGLAVSAAASPLVLDIYALAGGGQETVALAQLLARPEALAVVPTGVGAGTPGNLRIWDLTGPPAGKVFPLPALTGRLAFHTEVFPLRLGATAVATGVDDLAVPGTGAVALALQRPGASDVGSLDLQTLRVGDAVPQASATWLPAGVRQGDVLGVAAMDVDQDGLADLVLTLGLWTTPALWTDGALLWVKGAADPAAFATAAWQNLGTRAELGLADPAVLRPVDLGTVKGAAVWDRRGDRIVVFWPQANGALGVWKAPARGLAIRDLAAVDVAGSPLPDLVALGFDWATGAGTLLVFVDAADTPPSLAWAAGSPGVASRGADHEVAVAATDGQGPVSLAWTVNGAAAQAQDATLTLPGASLCGAAPVAVAVRGTDTGGQWRDLAGTVTVTAGAPSFTLAPNAPATVTLGPGGAAVPLRGSIWEACGGTPAFTPGGARLPATAVWHAAPSGTSVVLTLELPESAYAALLDVADPPTLTLTASDAGGWQSTTATRSLGFDARGLVTVDSHSDVSALAEGALAVVTTRVRSRIAAPLGQVTLHLALAGLEPAGAVKVIGAEKASEARVAGGVEVTLASLPGSDGAVDVQVTVRGLGVAGSASAEARSRGGYPLTKPVASLRGASRLPGCGCAAGGPGGDGVLALAALAVLTVRRRRPSPAAAGRAAR
ncbi:MAG: MYXO-CTERM sorting domain-containing protein [Anaeromyxobacteraceae bacterium]